MKIVIDTHASSTFHGFSPYFVEKLIAMNSPLVRVLHTSARDMINCDNPCIHCSCCLRDPAVITGIPIAYKTFGASSSLVDDDGKIYEVASDDYPAAKLRVHPDFVKAIEELGLLANSAYHAYHPEYRVYDIPNLGEFCDLVVINAASVVRNEMPERLAVVINFERMFFCAATAAVDKNRIFDFKLLDVYNAEIGELGRPEAICRILIGDDAYEQVARQGIQILGGCSDKSFCEFHH